MSMAQYRPSNDGTKKSCRKYLKVLYCREWDGKSKELLRGWSMTRVETVVGTHYRRMYLW